MSLQLNFPTLSSLDNFDGRAAQPFNWGNPDVQILDNIWQKQVDLQSNISEFNYWTKALLSDLRAAREVTKSQKIIDTIDCAIFVSCTPAIHASRRAGKWGECFDWIWASISYLHKIGGDRIQEYCINFLNLELLDDFFINQYLDCLPTFVESTFHLAYKLGGLDSLTDEIAVNCWCILATLREASEFRDDSLAISQMVVLAKHRRLPIGHKWACELLIEYEKSNDPHKRKNLAMTFITEASSFTDLTAAEWADKILIEHKDQLVEGEFLVLSSIILDGAGSWRLHKKAILSEIRKIREKYAALVQQGQSLLEVQEARVSILEPLLHKLISLAVSSDIIEVLHAWYGDTRIASCENDVLIISPSYNGSVAYVWPDGCWFTNIENDEGFNKMQKAIGRAIGSYIRGTDGDHHPESFENFRFDFPSRDHGHEMEQTMEEHYRLEELQEKLPEAWQPKSIIVFPSGPEPLQALLFKKTSLRAPVESSFHALAPLRPIKKINVWMGDLLMGGELELDALCAIAEKRGWEIKIHQPEAPSISDFRAFYEDAEADIVWIISHGEHDPFTIEGTGLVLWDKELTSLEDLSKLSIPNNDRRLLVLNCCSSAATQIRSGVGKIGVAQCLSSNNQSVIGNLWTINSQTASVFGALLAASLMDNDLITAALNGIEILSKPNEMEACLKASYRDKPELLDGLIQGSRKIRNITDWGCPIIVV